MSFAVEKRIGRRAAVEPGPRRWWLEAAHTPAREDLVALANLSESERVVCAALAMGRDRHAIATIMGNSTKTVDTHRGNVLLKLGVTSTADLTRFAIRVGLVDLGEPVTPPAPRKP